MTTSLTATNDICKYLYHRTLPPRFNSTNLFKFVIQATAATTVQAPALLQKLSEVGTLTEYHLQSEDQDHW